MLYSEAVSVMNGEKTIDDYLKQDESQNVQPQESETEVGNDSIAGENKDSEPPENKDENVVEEPDEGLEKADKKDKPRKSYSALEKQQHAFATQKRKRKEAEALLKQRDDEIQKLKEELEKYKGLTLEDFGNDQQKYTDYQIDQRLGNEKVKNMTDSLEQERRQMAMEEAAELADIRLQQCYPDEAEREKYQGLIQKAETDFASMHPEIGYAKFSDFLLSEKDRSVLTYLQDSDMAPKLIRHFIHKPEAALRIMAMRNPNMKFIELKQLENRMIQHERIMASKAKAVPPQPKVLPDTGKALNNNIIDSGPDWSRPWSKQDAVNWIKNHQH